MAICLACCARQYRPDVEPYESAVIRRVVALTQWNSNLSLSAYFDPLERWRLFWGCVIVMFLTGIAAEVAVALPSHRTMDGILRICRDNLDPESHPWMEAVARPYVNKDRILIICMAVVLFAAWTASWVYLRHALSRQGYRTKSSPATLRCVLVVYFVLTLGILAFAVYWLAITTKTHICLTYAPHYGQYEETQWGVGQIMAPFAWANMAVDVAYEVAESFTRALRRMSDQVFQVVGKRPKPASAEYDSAQTVAEVKREEKMLVPLQTVGGIPTGSAVPSPPEPGCHSLVISASASPIPSRPPESVAQPPKAHYPLIRHSCKY